MKILQACTLLRPRGSGPDKAIPTFLCYGDDEDYEDYEDDKDERDAANDNSQHALCR